MAQSSSANSTSLIGTKRRIKVRKRPSPTATDNNANDEEESDNYLPPAARDSKWVGLTFYNPNFETQIGDEITDEGEIRLSFVDEEEELPIYNLFPQLRETFLQRKSRSLLINDKSTTDITKSLVGQTPNFSHMKKTSKFIPMKLSLPSLKEIPVEEVEEIENSNRAPGFQHKPKVNTRKTSSDKKRIKRTSQPTVSHSSKEHYDEEDSDSLTNMTARKKRRTKKRADPSKDVESESSYSGLNSDKQKDNVSKPKKNSKEQKPVKQHSSQGSLADVESG